MGIKTVSAGGSEAIVGKEDRVLVLVEIIDGQEAYLTADLQGAPESGERLSPGTLAQIQSPGDRPEYLRAVGSEVRYQVIRQRELQPLEEVRPRLVDTLADSLSTNPVPHRVDRVVNTSPGKDTDIITDFDPPSTGTIMAKAVVASDSVLNVQETISGSTVTLKLNSGNTLTANDLHTEAVPVRADGTINLQIESAVEIDLLQVDFVPRMIA